MKKALLISILLLLSFLGIGQTGIHYQAVIRDAGGTILSEVPVTVDVTISPATGTPYMEQISTMTNEYGILNMVIGENGNMDLKDLNWEFGNASIDLEIQAGSKSILLEDQPIENVPYAFYSNIAQSAIDDEVEDDDADPMNEIQTLTYDSLNRSIKLSDGGAVDISPFTSKWMEDNKGIYTQNDVYLSHPIDTPNLKINATSFNYISPQGATKAILTPEYLSFDNEVFDAFISPGTISLEGLDGPYPYKNVMDTSGFSSTVNIFNERSTQYGGNFTALKMPDSNNIFSQMNTQGLVIRNGEISTNLNLGELTIGGVWPVNYAKLFGAGYGELSLYNNSDRRVAELSTETGPGVLTLSAENTTAPQAILDNSSFRINNQTHYVQLTNDNLMFAESGLGAYALLSGNGHGSLTLYNGGNWPAVQLNTSSGPGSLTVEDGAGLGNKAVLDFDQLQINNGDQSIRIDKDEIVFSEDGVGTNASLSGTLGLLTLNKGGINNSLSAKLGDMGGVGGLNLYGPSGQLNVELTHYQGIAANVGRINLYDQENLRFTAFTSSPASGQGGFAATFGKNGTTNILLTHSASRPSHGWIAVADENGVTKAGINVTSTGEGRVYGDVKTFKMAHPGKPGTSIYYACVEGPEVAAYDRGTARLDNGEVKVEFSEHFQIVGNLETMTVMLTPHSADTYGLAVIEKTEDGFIVKELRNGTGNFTFDWEVKCKRRGYENWQVEQKDIDNQPALPIDDVRH